MDKLKVDLARAQKAQARDNGQDLAPDPTIFGTLPETSTENAPQTRPYPFGEVFLRKLLKLAITSDRVASNPDLCQSRFFGSLDGSRSLRPPRQILAEVVEQFMKRYPGEYPGVESFNQLVQDKAQRMKPAERQVLEEEWQAVRIVEVPNPTYVIDEAEKWAEDQYVQMTLTQANALAGEGRTDEAKRVAAQLRPLLPLSPRGEGENRWPVLDREKGLYGIIGALVKAVEPMSESDTVALLTSMSVAIGSAIGRGPFFKIRATRHYLNEFICLVGETALARKGTALNEAKAIVQDVDLEWMTYCQASGLSSGEGLIHRVRDPSDPAEKKDDTGAVYIDYKDKGVGDKRLLIVEEELSGPLKRARREGNSLNDVLRLAWDHGNLGTITRKSPLRASNAHISIIAHSTIDDLARNLTDTDRANGFGNRFCWFVVRVSKILDWEDIQRETPEHSKLHEAVRRAITYAKKVGRMTMAKEAQDVWNPINRGRFSKGKPGLLGMITNRAAPHVLRFAFLYAVLDHSEVVKLPHLEAAIALWDYAEASAQLIFGERLGNTTAERLRDALRERGRMDRTEMQELFDGHLYGKGLDDALDVLKRNGVARLATKVATGGRRKEVWESLPGAVKEVKEVKEV